MMQFLRDYFSLNRRERNGVIVLLAILCMLLIWLGIMRNRSLSEPLPEVTEEEIIRQPEIPNHIESSPETISAVTLRKDEKIKVTEYFFFDPNNLTDIEWKKLGLKEKQIRTIQHYLQKGGKFRKKEDLKKIYGISPVQFGLLESYIQIPQVELSDKIISAPRAKSQHDTVFKRKHISVESIELNEADSLLLVSLPGIGPSFAKRILGYRKLLGGFVAKEQLKEIYGFTVERYVLISELVFVNQELAKKINVNKAAALELKQHPYIRWNLANSIVAYRKQHGVFHSIDDLQKLELMKDSIFNRVKPYLSVHD